jgi:hypothetical protein
MTHKITLTGHLTNDTLLRELAIATEVLEMQPERPLGLLFDVLQMTGYDQEIRTSYIEWHRRHHRRLGRVAVVTTSSLWRVVVSAVGLATRGQVRTFPTVEQAAVWVGAYEARANL